jgi:hypothetical protein
MSSMRTPGVMLMSSFLRKHKHINAQVITVVPHQIHATVKSGCREMWH